MRSPSKIRRRRHRAALEPLEPRVLYSADPLGLGLDLPALPDLVGEAESSLPAPQTVTDVFFIDQSVANPAQLASEITARALDDQAIAIYIIDDTQSISDINETLQQHNNLNSLQFISHGFDSNIRLGTTLLSSTTVADLEDELSKWGESLSDQGDLLFYGCNIAESESGKLLIDTLAGFTGADVAASEDLTGHSKLAGDWTLEYLTGDIAVESLILEDGIEAWQSVLSPIEVTTEDDVVDGDISSFEALRASPGPDLEISLREAVLAANAEPDFNTITLPAGNYDLDLNPAPGTDNSDQFIGDLDIWNSLHLVGNDIGDTTIDAKNLDRALSFLGGSSIVENVKIQNGETNEFGGGILVSNSSVTLKQVDLHNNESLLERGGGIYTDGLVTINIEDSIIRNNTAGKDLANLESGGAIHNWTGTVNLSRTEIFDNEGSYGGAIFNHGLLTLKDSWLHTNEASVSGGAIHNEGFTEIDRTLFESNQATNGGGISNAGGAEVRDSIFAKNRATEDAGAILSTSSSSGAAGNIDLYSSTLAFNRADANFGAIDIDAGTVRIQSSIIDETITDHGPDIDPNVISLGYNLTNASLGTALDNDLTNTDPKIADTLSDVGAFTRVYELEPDSPAINAGTAIAPSNYISTQDVTGAARNEVSDIGAYEYKQTSDLVDLYWSDANTIFHGNSESKEYQAIVTNNSLTTQPFDIEVDIQNGLIFWVESDLPNPSGGFGALYSARLDGSDITPLATGISNPQGLALDIENNQIFVTRDSTNNNTSSFDDNAIDRYTYDGTLLTPPAIEGHHTRDPGSEGLNSPIDVDFDEASQNLVWLDRGNNNGGIHLVDSSGSPSTILNSSALGLRNLSITPGGASVYWNGVFFISHTNISDGTEISSTNTLGIEGFTSVEHHPETNKVYAATFGASNDGRILSYDDNLTGRSDIYTNLALPVGIATAGLSIVNDAPSVETNTGVTVDEASTAIITRENLNSIDPDDNPQDNEFTITEFPLQGELWISDSRQITALNPTFAQSEITSDKLEYRHNGSEEATDQFKFTISDGALSSAEKQFDININAVNDTPQLSFLESTALEFVENDPALNISSLITISDGDDSDLQSALIKVDTGFVASEDILHFSNIGNITGQWTPATGELRFTGTDTIANYELALRSVTYQNTSDDPDTSPRTFSVTVNDGEIDSLAATRSINITAENDAPIISTLEPAVLNYIEGDGKVAISNSVTLTDSDNISLTALTAQISSGYNSAEDSLASPGFGAISWTWNPASAELELSSTQPQPLADFQAALRTVTYENTSSTPDTAPREISIIANDGISDSSIATRTIEITPTNTDPIINLSGPGSYQEGNPYTIIDSAALVSDPDSIDFDGGQLQITITTGANSDDRVGVISVGDGPGEVNVSDATIFYEGIAHGTITSTLNGDSPLTIDFNSATTSTSVQAILRNVGYLNLSDSPSTSVGFEVSLTDGDGGSALSSQSITITPTNDPPLITNLDGAIIQAQNNGTAYPLDSSADALVIDRDSPLNFGNGYLLINKTNFGAGDTLSVNSSGNVSLSSGLSDGSIVSVSGVNIGALTDITGSSFAFSFNSNATAIQIDQILHALEFLSTDPAPGIRTIDLSLTDGDGTVNGGEDTSTATIKVVLGEMGTITATEDIAYTFEATDFEFTGITGNNLSSITITSLPLNGTLNLDGSDVNVGQKITRTEIESGEFSFDPDPETSGTPYASFDFSVNSGNLSLNVLSGHTSNYTLDSSLTSAARIIANDILFSPTGIVTTDLSILNATSTVDTAYLSNGHILFSGYLPDGTLSAAELADIDEWVLGGGILIATSDLNDFDDITSYYGLPVSNGGSTLWNVNNTDHPITTGIFGNVTNIRGVGAGGYFESSDIATDDLVLASHSTTGNPSLVLREHGNGHILFSSDEGIFRQDTTGDGTLNTQNDIFIANVFAWAIESLAPKEIYSLPIDVQAVNDGPILTLPDSPTYTENSQAELILPNAAIADIDSTDFDGGTINIIPDTGTSIEDTLSVTPTGAITIDSNTGDIRYAGTIIGHASGGEGGLPLTVSLNSNSDVTSTQALLRAIGFHSTSDNPEATINFSADFTDGDGGTDSKTFSLTINQVNDSPFNSGALPGSVTVTEDSLSPIDLTSVLLADVDSGSGVLTLNLSVSTDGRLTAASQSGITTTGNNTNTLTISGTLSDLNTYLANPSSIAYLNSESGPIESTADILLLSIADNGNSGSGNATAAFLGSVNIIIAPTNDDPLNIGSIPTDLRVVEDTLSEVDLSAIIVSDPDDGGSSNLTITLETSNSGELSAEHDPNIIIGGNSSAITLKGTLSHLNAYIGNPTNLKYLHPDEHYNGNNADTTVWVNDNGNTGAGGGTDINLGTIPIHIDAVNDAPKLTFDTTVLSYTENDGLTALTNSASITDADNTNLRTATLTINTGYQSGEDILSFTDSSGITGNWDPLNGALTLTGNTTLAIFENAIRSVTYQNTSDHPDTNNRVVSIFVSDGTSDSVIQSRFIEVSRLNDAPDIGSVTLPSIEEDESSPTPYNVGSLLSPQFSDPDADNTLLGIAIMANTATTAEGQWQYATDAITWQPIDSTTASSALAIDSATWIRFLPATNYNGTPPSLDFRAIDSSYTGPFSENSTRIVINALSNGGTTPLSSNVASIDITVTPVNDAPEVSAGALLPDSFEDASSPASNTIASIFSGLVNDSDDSSNFTGIAVTAAPAANGYWQYSVNGSEWTNITDVTNANALMLDSSTHIRFLPNLNYHGIPSPLTVHAVDDTYTGLFTTPTSLQHSNAQTTGGTTAYSHSSTLSTEVVSVNDRPFASDATLADIPEDDLSPAGARIDNLYANNFDDIEGTLSGIAVHQNLSATEGQWQYTTDGELWSDIGTVSISNAVILSEDSSLRFLPSTDYNGMPPAISVRVIDDTYPGPYTTSTSIAIADLTSLPADSAFSSTDSRINLSVLAINDPPSGQNTSVTMDEGAVKVFSISDFGFSDLVENHAFDRLIVNSLPSSGLLTLNGVAVFETQVITISDINANQLEYTPPPQANGNAYTQWDFTVADNGGTANLGTDQDQSPNTITININAVNDAPFGSDFSTTILEDASLTFAAEDFGFNDPDDGHSIAAVEISTIPLAGTLSLNGESVLAGTSVTVSDIVAGKLTYQPNNNDHGSPYDQFDFHVIDDGGTTNGGTDKSINTNTVFLDVLPVNDPPTAGDNTVHALEDIEYVFNLNDFGFEDHIDNDLFNAVTIVTPPANETLTLFGQPVSALDSISVADIRDSGLVFLAPPQANGANYDDLEFRVVDSGDNTNGGQSASIDNYIISIDVLAVNDQPFGLNNTVVTSEDTPYQFKSTDFGLIDPEDGHTLDRIMVVSEAENGILTNNGAPVTPGTIIPVREISTGSLIFTPASNINGVAISAFDFRAIDNGGTTNGGIDTAGAATTITIDVSPVNDPPSGQNHTIQSIEDTPVLLDSTVFGFNDIDASDTLSAVIIDAIIGQGQLISQGQVVTAGQTISSTTINAGELYFEPEAHSFGEAHTMIEFRPVDSGDATGNLNIATTSSIITFNVAPVNDAPHNIVPSSTQVSENSPAATVAQLRAEDQDPADTHTFSVDDERFQVVDNVLKLRDDISLDFEAESEITLTLTAVDEAGSQHEQPVILQVIDANDAPVPISQSTQHAAVAPFSFTLPQQTFIDEDGDSLSYSATLKNGEPLPPWLKFDPATLEFTVNTPDSKIDSIEVTVSADDGQSKAATTDIEIKLEPAFSAALPAEAPAEAISRTEPELEETPEKPESPPATETTAPIFDKDAGPTTEGAQDQEQSLPEPPEINQAEFTELEIEVIEITQNRPVKQANDSLFIDIQNNVAEQRAKENLLTQVALSRLANQMDTTTQTMRDTTSVDKTVLSSSVTIASGLSVGYVFWILRSGTLLASVITSLPAWRYIDPLPVLDSLNDDENENDSETLESMVEDDNKTKLPPQEQPVAKPTGNQTPQDQY